MLDSSLIPTNPAAKKCPHLPENSVRRIGLKFSKEAAIPLTEQAHPREPLKHTL